jgi:hypothetical protein
LEGFGESWTTIGQCPVLPPARPKGEPLIDAAPALPATRRLDRDVEIRSFRRHIEEETPMIDF